MSPVTKKYCGLKRILFLPLYFFILSFSSAQSLSHSVIGATGAEFTSANGSLSWTLGETMTETYQKTNGIFTQGFQQPNSSKKETRVGIFVYPNPTPDYLFVEPNEAGEFQFEIFNLNGQTLINKKSVLNTATQIHRIDLLDFRAALYFLRVTNRTTGKSSIYKIIKL